MTRFETTPDVPSELAARSCRRCRTMGPGALGLSAMGDVTRRASLLGNERLIMLYGDNPSAPSAIAHEFGLEDGEGGLMRPIGSSNAAGVGDA